MIRAQDEYVADEESRSIVVMSLDALMTAAATVPATAPASMVARPAGSASGWFGDAAGPQVSDAAFCPIHGILERRAVVAREGGVAQAHHHNTRGESAPLLSERQKR